ncbi:serine hydrolase domain-containing protein [Halalkalicoccus jeotgali]|uniref:Beta-lactamase n=1 Tax=Halalkalicoccus jeotgali (strain DSM 18796 / CECT 7217 / JCM 14584 / KCTC 4019 / B3) TaxID=795797 RepID=D8J4L1_HALJB|nr:serine hydrolase domain-containing protein [Halalkalicoccus jeotgali]ADJ13573.1 beta-lactamase [Halalkalicoccus jeotgali B3]ELY33131.1 beta-lactamase [Halalkalicoccus jeotgali B3]
MSPSTDISRRTVLKGAGAAAAGAVAGRPAGAQSDPDSPDPDGLETFVDGLMAEGLAEHDVAGATVAVVGGGETLLAKGYGRADVENDEPVDAEETLFRIGSVSKLFGWTGVMQGVERGEFDLDTDVNEYLEDVTIPGAYSEPVTLDHLGTHTPGFEERYRGTFVEDPEDLRPLGETLAGEQPTRVRPPGELAAYSNYGAALAGHIVAEQAGTSFGGYVQANVFEPLGMDHSTFAQPVPEGVGEVSKGYRYQDGEFVEGEFEYVGIAPAGSMSATATDMARFMRAHLAGGELKGTRILEAGTVEAMHRRRFAHDERVDGICYGFYEMSHGGERAIGHGGDTELFHSQLLLAPEQDLGLFVSYNSPGGTQAREEFIGAFLDRYLGEPDPPAVADGVTRGEALTGSYRAIRYPHTTYEKIGALGGAMEVRIDDDALVTELPGAGVERWIEVEPLVFRREDGGDTLVFEEDDGEITHLFLGSVPVMAFERLAWYEATTAQLAVVGLSLLVFLSAVVGWSALGLWHRMRDRPPGPERPRIARWTAGLASALFVGFAVGLGTLVAVDPNAILFEAPPALLGLLALPVLGVVATLGTLACCVLAWHDGDWGVLSRLHYTLVALTCVVFLAVLRYWNLLGFRL